MTSISGFNIVKAPCCGALYQSTAYASLNMLGWQRWSDGHEGGSLYHPTNQICQCTACNKLFLATQVEQVEFVSYKSKRDNPQLDKPEAPLLPYLKAAQAYEHVKAAATFPSQQIECGIRLQIWRSLNTNERREKAALGEDEFESGTRYFIERFGFRRDSQEPWESMSDSEIVALQKANLKKLIPLLELCQPENLFLIGNAYRALGDKTNAIACFEKSTQESTNVRTHFVEQAKAGDRSVIRIEPPEWREPIKMPEPWINTCPGKNPLVLSSQFFWFKIFGMLNQLWAVIEPSIDSESVTIYWIDDNACLFKSQEFAGEQDAWDFLAIEGYKRFEEELGVWEILCPPGGPYQLKEKDNAEQG